MSDKTIEQHIQDLGLNAPRVTPDDIEKNIVDEYCFTAAEGLAGREVAPITNAPASLGLVTVCVLILQNGTKVVGVNEGPVSAANFNADLGRKLARQKAVDQIWPMMGYELRTKISAGG